MNRSSEKALISSAVRGLRGIGIAASAGRDAVLSIDRDGKTLRFHVEVKQRLTPSVLGLVTLAFEDAKDDRLLVTDYVTPHIAEELQRRHIQFADSAGNAYLNRRGVLVLVTGRRLQTASAAPRPSRVFQATGIKVVFAILSAPQLLGATQRKMASAAGVALGSVAIVLEGLSELGYVAEVGGTRRIVNRERLLQQWAEAYARVLEPTLELGRFSAATPNWWQDADLAAHGAQWGGETAAALLHRHLRPERTLIYAGDIPHSLMSRYRLKADDGGTVILRQRFWNSVPGPRADIVPPPLIYADLMAAGDARSIDAAKRIRDAYQL